MGQVRTSTSVLLHQLRAGLALDYRTPAEMRTDDGCFATCWGNVNDRMVDSVLAVLVRPAVGP